MKIDKIYVISLDHSKEKIKEIITRLGNLGVETTPYEIVFAHDGKNQELPSGFNVYNGWKLPNTTNKFWKNQVTPGEIGCSISHLTVWNKVVEEGHNRVLVLEEDFKVLRPMNGLTDNELAIEDWDFCYLGRYSFPDSPNREITENLVIPGNSYNSHAYLLTNRGANTLLNSGLKDNIIPVDEFIPAMYMEHRRPDVNTLFKGKIKAISTKVDWITQTSNSQTSTTEANETYYEILDTKDWQAWLSKYVDQTIARHQWDLIVDEHRDTNIFEFPLFTKKFCDDAVALAESKNKWTIDRHAAYPTNDVLLTDIGLNEIYNRVLREIVYPLCIHLWHFEGPGWDNMVSENFLARYTTDRQSHLALHHDYSHVTMVVKLNDEFDGGGTWFPKYKILSSPERVGTATLHPGLVTHLHGARPITAGKRYINVSFMRKNDKNI